MTYIFANGDDVELYVLRPSKCMKRVSANFTNEQRMVGLKSLYDDVTVYPVPVWISSCSNLDKAMYSAYIVGSPIFVCSLLHQMVGQLVYSMV